MNTRIVVGTVVLMWLLAIAAAVVIAETRLTDSSEVVLGATGSRCVRQPGVSSPGFCRR